MGKKHRNFVIIYADDLGYTQTSVPMMKDRPELANKLHQTPISRNLPGAACVFQMLIVRHRSAHLLSPVFSTARPRLASDAYRFTMS